MRGLFPEPVFLASEAKRCGGCAYCGARWLATLDPRFFPRQRSVVAVEVRAARVCFSLAQSFLPQRRGAVAAGTRAGRVGLSLDPSLFPEKPSAVAAEISAAHVGFSEARCCSDWGTRRVRELPPQKQGGTAALHRAAAVLSVARVGFSMDPSFLRHDVL